MFLENLIAKINPHLAEKRQKSRMKLNYLKSVQNSGYSEGGASRRKNALKGFRANSYSPLEDIDVNLDLLRQRSRTLFMTSPIAASAIKLNRTNMIGAGLKLKCRIDSQLLGLSQEQAEAWERKTEKEFALWAGSKHCDTLGLNDFYELQSIAFISWLLNGDAFVLMDYEKPTPYMPYTLRLHLIEGDRISNPKSSAGYVSLNQKAENGNRIFNGIEVDNKGKIVAYYICNTYQNGNMLAKKEWVRVQAIGEKTGIPNVLHIMEAERAEQYRGVPYLAPIIVVLRQLTQYTEAELMAAVINGIFSVFITTSDGGENMDFDGSIEDFQKAYETGDYQLGAGLINYLAPGEDIKMADATRPNVNFDTFASAMCKYMGAALEIPYEVLIKSFNNNYSASRAALLELWKYIKMRRSWFINDFCQPIYEIFLTEAVASGRIQAPGFLKDPALKWAWCKAEWNGPAQGQLDPIKEATAAKIRVEQGFSTRERETVEMNGGDFVGNVTQAEMENKKMIQAGLKEDGKS